MSTRSLVYAKSFQKAYIKFIRKSPYLKSAIAETLSNLQEDSFSSKLKTHKLSGNLMGVYACSCGYDCRIIFSIETDVILLIDIGTHDDVY